MNRAVSMINYPLNSKIPIPQNYMTEAFGETIVVPDARSLNAFGGSYDTKGNVRVTQIIWKSLRKIGKRVFFDEYGDRQEDFVDEFYKADETAGEEIEWIWVTEWMEGTRISGDIYIKMQPLPRIGLNMSNPSKCMPPFVGVVYNINSNRAMSLMSYLKPYQYLYNALMYNTELAITKSKGRIPLLPLHLIPDGWDLDSWMYYFNVMGVGVVDAFKEGQKGSAAGKLAGHMNSLPTEFNLDMGNYIQNNVIMMNTIRQHVDEISGVSPQRQGQVDNRETLGGVERAVTQSSHITEKWFFIHDMVKVKVLEVLLETAKYAWRNKKLKRQYVMDDMTMAVLDMDGDNFATAEYSVVVANASSDMKIVSALEQLAQAGLQNDKLNFSDIMDIYMTDSVASMRRKIQASEQRREKAQGEQFAEEKRQFDAQLKQAAADKQADRDTKIEVALIMADSRQQTSEPVEETDDGEMDLKVKKHEDDTQIKRETLAETKRKNQAAEALKAKDLQIKASKPKPKTSK
jgi:hypothetical protein